MPIRINFVGVWETVGELGIPLFNIPGISRSTLGFLHTGLRLPIEYGFHALAIDEHRRAFSPTVYTENSNSDIMVMQSAKDRVGMDTSGSLNWARERRVLI